MKKIIVILLSFVFSSDAFGFSYDYFSDGLFTTIHVLTVDPKEHAIMPVRASGKEFSRETAATLVSRYGAAAAVNGGFWKLDGHPAGILKIDRHWYGTPMKPRGAIGWSLSSQQVLIDRVLTNTPLNACPDGCEIEVIPMSDPIYTTAEEWKAMDYIVGGTPVLVREGNVIEDFSPEQTLESFLTHRHPRTAVGIRENGEWVFVVVDGRLYQFFGGMTMKELAQFMLELGCIDALNLDGGSSSVMIVEGIIVNDPCGTILEEGKYVEAISDAILILSSV